MAEEQDERGFTFSDKRHSAQQEGEAERPQHTSQPSHGPAGERERTAAGSGRQASPPREEVTFASFLLSLGSQAFMHLGDIPNPVTQKREKDLAAAQQMIDLLAMLQAKTQGNLSNEEERLLQQLLFDLRMRFVRERGR